MPATAIVLGLTAPWPRRWSPPVGGTAGRTSTPNLAPYMALRLRMSWSACSRWPRSRADDVVYDLGSGTGRLVITAAKRFGARGVGVDIDAALITQSRAHARQEGVENLVEFRQQDALTVDVSPATVVTLYLFSGANLKLRPTLQKQLSPGSRVVSHQFGMGDWVPTRTETIIDQRGTSRLLYLWIIGPS